MTDARICITGYGGALGIAVAKALAQRSNILVGVDSRKIETEVPFERTTRSDIHCLDWDAVLRGCAAVIHLAAYVHSAPRSSTDVERVYAVNYHATAKLAIACRERGVSLIAASTVAVLDAMDGGEAGSSNSPTANHYAKSKLLGEEAIRSEGAKGLSFAIVRFPLLYGPNGRGNMEKMLRAIIARRYWPIDGRRTRKSCLYYDDAARALILAGQTPAVAGGAFVVSPPTAPTLTQIHLAAYRAAERIMPSPLPKTVAMALGTAASRALSVLDIRTSWREHIETLTRDAEYDGTQFAQLTGFVPTIGLDAGLGATVAWIRTAQLGDRLDR